MKVKIIDMDKPNANGRIYPLTVVENAFKKYKEHMIDKGSAIIFNKNSNDLANAYGIVKDITIEGKEGFVELKPLSLNGVETFTSLLEHNKLSVVTSGIGTVKDNVIQDDFELRWLFLTDDPSHSN
jgi:GTPase involved in cell partitioning and DNA repair